MKEQVILEPLAKKVSRNANSAPKNYQISIEEGRKRLEDTQNSIILKYPAEIKTLELNTGPTGKIKIYAVIPISNNKQRNIIFYIHGAGWVYGSFHTHEKLVRELASRTNSIVIFPEYTRSPEAKFPLAIEQCYQALCRIPFILEQLQLTADLENLTVAGDSAGGNIAIAMTLLAKFRSGPKIDKQLLYYPVTNDNFNTTSYHEFSEGYYLDRDSMKWFWNQYIPDVRMRNYIVATPLKASLEQLKNLPKALIITAEADVLRDEGMAYATKLMASGVDVSALCIKGTIHDFVMLNDLDPSNGCRLAMDASVAWISRKDSNQNSK